MTAGATPSGAPQILVVGSINMDLVVKSSRLPSPGETLTGQSLREIPGGKGANQAVAATRLGAAVSLIGRLGDDGFGRTLRRQLATEGVNAESVRETRDCSSGIAVIGVEDSGQNCITIIPGANGQLTPHDVAGCEAAFNHANLLLVQLEVPLETVLRALQTATSKGVVTLLDPAPAVAPFPAELLQVDYVLPNETEAEVLTGLPVDTPEQAIEAAARLRGRGAKNAIITLGDSGAVYCDESGRHGHVPAFPIEAVDTTAAGDAFAAAFAVQIAAGCPIRNAIRFGCAAGALAASREGAQPGMPTHAEVARLAGPDNDLH